MEGTIPEEEKSLQKKRNHFNWNEKKISQKKSIPEDEDPPKRRYFGGYFSGEDTPKEIKKDNTTQAGEALSNEEKSISRKFSYHPCFSS
ncbi:8468_t:CDS:2 [Racocetra persica]|uniref:8468_t:CDS:1 n=1 Tax=Racocetra persica TaxID=160502 RepID=A0ACA9QTF2_9GLOM|nr:8468_t:CDS:2 [Racocetra persica]